MSLVSFHAVEWESKRFTDVRNSSKANCLSHFVSLLGCWFSFPLLSLPLWCFASYFFIYPYPSFSSSSLPLAILPLLHLAIKEQISIAVGVFQVHFNVVDLTAHIMISACFNSRSCNQLFLFLCFFFYYLKKGRFARDVIRHLIVCVACQLSSSFLEQSGKALINRLIEESDSAWILLSPSLCVWLFYFCIFFSACLPHLSLFCSDCWFLSWHLSLFDLIYTLTLSLCRLLPPPPPTT